MGVYLEGAFAVMASEASLVVDTVICRQLIHQIHSLITGHAFLGCSCKRHAFQFSMGEALVPPSLTWPLMGSRKQEEEEIRKGGEGRWR